LYITKSNVAGNIVRNHYYPEIKIPEQYSRRLSVFLEHENSLGRRLIVRDVMELPGRIDELFTEFGVGDLSELHDALVDAPALELGDAAFGNHEGHVAAGFGHKPPLG